MTRIFFKYCTLALFVVIASCTPDPAIQIGDTLEIALGKKYSDYVVKLNASVKGDTSALHNFLLVDDLYDGAAYDHGWVLIELMQKLDDETFASGLSKLNKEQLDNLNMYFKGGLDIHAKSNELASGYLISFNALGIANENKIKAPK